MGNQYKEDIRKMTFGKFDTKEDMYETKKQFEAGQYGVKKQKGKKTDTSSKTEKKRNSKQPITNKIQRMFSKEKAEEIPEIWTGQTSVLDILAPSSIDNGSRDYIVVDGIYHSYLYIAGYGYRTRNGAAWLWVPYQCGRIGIC